MKMPWTCFYFFSFGSKNWEDGWLDHGHGKHNPANKSNVRTAWNCFFLNPPSAGLVLFFLETDDVCDAWVPTHGFGSFFFFSLLFGLQAWAGPIYYYFFLSFALLSFSFSLKLGPAQLRVRLSFSSARMGPSGLLFFPLGRAYFFSFVSNAGLDWKWPNLKSWTRTGLHLLFLFFLLFGLGCSYLLLIFFLFCFHTWVGPFLLSLPQP